MISSDEVGRLYRQLNVTPHATRDEIVRAYRRLVHGAHPDVHPEDPEAVQRFRELTEAYKVLSDPARRASYDRKNRICTPRTETGSANNSTRPEEQLVSIPVSIRWNPLSGPHPPLWAGPVSVSPSPGSRPVSIAASPRPTVTFPHLLSQLIDFVWYPWRS